MAVKKKETKTDTTAFVNRKLQALNTVGDAKAEKAMTRIISKNKGGLA